MFSIQKIFQQYYYITFDVARPKKTKSLILIQDFFGFVRVKKSQCALCTSC